MTTTPFVNEPLTDFSDPGPRAAFEGAILRCEARFGQDYPLVIGGERITTGQWIESRNPSQHDQVVGRVAKAGTAEGARAVEAARAAFRLWSQVPADERARVGLRAAAIMRRRRHELSALIVLEVGKNWVEADADTAEAIDFLEFYARQAERLGAPQPLTRIRGTDNELRYLPLGVGVAISPWNFPLAIATGLVASAILAGNTVVFKPASAAPVTGAVLVEVLEQAGLPQGVVNFVPGAGDVVGEALVQHPEVRFVNFTGSREVGVRLYELAARVAPGQRWLKRAVAEMGGKNAVIVHASADLDEAIAGITASAFGYQGQKCSACSRVIAEAPIYETVVERMVARAEKLRLGPAKLYETEVGPVIDPAQFRKVSEYIAIGRGEGRLVAGGETDDSVGYFISPTIFADVEPDRRIMQEEIFGPVVAVSPARDFDHALAIANGTVYGLTGGVYARDPLVLERARREFHVGNLYFNRKITGALVGVEPFGGFNMSGTNAKAGGEEYLKLFLQQKVISERV